MIRLKKNVDYKKYTVKILTILDFVDKSKNLSWPDFRRVLHQNPKDDGQIFSKAELVYCYRKLKEDNHPKLPKSPDLPDKIRMKPTRTQSGVTPVTVLTKPFPCPGQCIFCPNDLRMPKSYMSDEPGAQRAERNGFDPYLQTFSRLQALDSMGHQVDKIELIILGGTWSYYPEKYQIWFIKRCFQAINDFGENNEQQYEKLLTLIGDPDYRNKEKNEEVIRNVQAIKPRPFSGRASQTYNQFISDKIVKEKDSEYILSQKATWEELFEEHKKNERAKYKCSGLVIETRPDNISEDEVIRIRKLGCTKTQIGFQSLNDDVLQKNYRGHNVAATKRAVKLLRQAGYKIHAHWMANLYGSDPKKDVDDYKRIFNNKDFRPDELKVYPCSLIETAELMDYYEAGLWEPYSREELLEVLVEAIKNTPQYCRLTRVIRDIPSTDIVVGNKQTNFREVAEKELVNRGITAQEIRSREVRNLKVTREELNLKIIEYETSFGTEKFLQFVTKENKLAGFLRLSLPNKENNPHPFIKELSNSSIIREIHIYGQVVNVGNRDQGRAQHLGLGRELIEEAKNISQKKGYAKMAVISAVGTREYYRKRGFIDGELYQFMSLKSLC
jgi:elongator complex protein 3